MCFIFTAAKCNVEPAATSDAAVHTACIYEKWAVKKTAKESELLGKLLHSLMLLLSEPVLLVAGAASTSTAGEPLRGVVEEAAAEAVE